ncbi:hypothetical protein AB0K09_13855 [Streptomyces sp. NPDC049577]|uniref:hypothetical protein n=1 Tax=Streptomyces sp. NPDC049577 TaxID=3155153 RepID=UPI003434C28A
MASVRRLVAAVVTVVVSAAVLGQAPVALADDHQPGGGGLPVLVVSPAPGKITKERKVTETYQYDAKGGSSSQDSSGSSSQPPAPSAPEPGPVSNLKDTVNNAAQSATSGASSTVDSTLK